MGGPPLRFCYAHEHSEEDCPHMEVYVLNPVTTSKSLSYRRFLPVPENFDSRRPPC